MTKSVKPHTIFISTVKPVDVKKVRRELGVKRVLEGSVRKAGKKKAKPMCRDI